MPLWIGETWTCVKCEWVNAVIRSRCRNCGEAPMTPPPPANPRLHRYAVYRFRVGFQAAYLHPNDDRPVFFYDKVATEQEARVAADTHYCNLEAIAREKKETIQFWIDPLVRTLT